MSATYADAVFLDTPPEHNSATGRMPNATTPPTPRHVLLIEDDDDNRAVIRRVLELRPHATLVEAENGAAGIESAIADLPALVILDNRLPDMSGMEVLRRLQSHPTTASVPVVVLSADALRGSIDAMLAAGATDYLTKPFRLSELLATIDRFTASPFH